MRYDKRYDRVFNLITAQEIPRTPAGGIALCHACQRAVYWAKGFLRLFRDDLERAARWKIYIDGQKAKP